MVKTKLKGIARWLCLAVFALCISLCLAMATTNTAYAATTPKYTLAYDYTHYYNYNTSKSADGSGTGVLSASVKGDNGSMTTVQFYIYGSSTSGTANLTKGGAIASNSLTITLDASIQGYSMSVTNSSGTTVGSQSGKNYTLSNLSDGTYNFTCSLRGAGWNPNARAYAWYSMDVSSSFVVDTTAPTINGASTSSTGKYTNASTYISVSDSGSGAEALYMKAPGNSYYSNVGTSTTVSSTATNGLYYFYAKDKAGNTSSTEIPATGHNFELAESSVVDGENIRTYVCTNCGAITTQNMGEQYEKVSSYVEYLFEQYQPYMWWVLLATAGVWSVVMGVFFGIAAKNEDKEKARKMIKNYVIGLVVIAVILVACPYLVRGIAALIAG